MYHIYRRGFVIQLLKGSLVAMVVVWMLPLTAHAQYMNRWNEVKQTIVDDIAVDEIKRDVSSRINTVFNARGKALKDALGLLTNASASEENAGDDWNQHLQGITIEVVSQLGSLADQTAARIAALEEPPSPESLQALPDQIGALAAQQEGLLLGLWRSNPAEVRDILVLDKRDYDEAYDSMEQRRDYIRSQFKTIESNAASYRDKILSAGQRAIDTIPAKDRELSGYLASVLNEDVNPNDVDRRVSGYVSDMEQALKEFVADVEYNLERLESNVPSRERSIIAMLHETRGRIEAMVDERNPPVVMEVFDEVDAAMNTLHNGRPAGDIRDLAELVPVAIDRVETHLEAFEGAFVRFIGEYEGFFVEQVSRETADELLYTAKWQRWSSDIQGLNLASAFNQAASNASNHWSASLSRLPDETQTEVEAILDDESDRLLNLLEVALSVTSRLQAIASPSSRQAIRSLLQG